MELKPEDYRNYMIRGVVYGRNRNFSKAMADFEQALQMNPNSGKIYSYGEMFIRIKRTT